MPARCLLAISIVCLPLESGSAWGDGTSTTIIDTTDTLQVLADLTLIDSGCPGATVNFGIGFRFAAEKGVADTTVMPGGSRHAAFEAVLRARRASFDRDAFCGEIAENYAEALPGSVSLRPGASLR